MQIVVESEIVKVRKGTSQRTGKPYELREQEVVVHGVGRFPVITKLTLPEGNEGYKAGTYEVTTPFNVGRYGLEVSRDLGLVPARLKNAA
ncbi:single-stranded DNA-binding protein [Luteibacter sp. 22Crub2.1]|uniref:single-stranded DNA-binding protein n=1 Tax=Luteibacter sp. 22Crub2.1 TaxID=1283288 RepID=UPI0009A71DA9|nr:single-stranded DNA-binding protein [Luteibacter sp. 22Crub2.1]SKB73777.1 Helix-destabilising protein [Luteibacter sp. 22Crub2.1]